jgi:hypothetical protein
MCRFCTPDVGNLANTFEARSAGVHSPGGNDILWVVGLELEFTKVIQSVPFPLFVILRYVVAVDVVVTFGNLL